MPDCYLESVEVWVTSEHLVPESIKNDGGYRSQGTGLQQTNLGQNEHQNK